ncbi:MAG: hypothetical protein ACI9P8_000834, partial [Bacteroidia bacterium]
MLIVLVFERLGGSCYFRPVKPYEMKRLLFTVIGISQLLVVFGQQNEIQTALFELPDVSFEEIKTPDDFESAFELKIKQPIDHQDPSKGYFHQKAFLSHRGFDKTNVMVTEGYQRTKNRVYELTELLDANQIQVEHRYYGKSLPDSMDYQYLTLEQATADLHNINELFRKIYDGKWVSTGISKGGQTTIYYRFFYPEDVDVSVPYVAPLTQHFEDERIYKFLDTVGTKECRAAILDVQKRVLQNREAALDKMKWYSKGAGLTFNYHSLEEAFEFAVLEYPFSFWQWGTKCEDIPSSDVSFDSLLTHFVGTSGVDFFSDRDVKAYASHYYQAASQMGYYGYETEELEGLIKALPMKPHPHAAFTPNKMKVEFHNSVPLATAKWIKVKGNRFLHIYGAADTWTANAVRPTKGVDAEWFFMSGKDHGAARIKNMTEADQKRFIGSLEKWLEVKIENPFKSDS